MTRTRARPLTVRWTRSMPSRTPWPFSKDNRTHGTPQKVEINVGSGAAELVAAPTFAAAYKTKFSAGSRSARTELPTSIVQARGQAVSPIRQIHKTSAPGNGGEACRHF